MTRAEKLAEKWVREHGAKGEYQTSLDVIQEVAFESGYAAAVAELRSEEARHGYVDKKKGPIVLGNGHEGPTLMAACMWAEWLEREENAPGT